MFFGYNIKYLFHKVVFRTFKGANCSIGEDCDIRRSKILVSCGANLRIGNNVVIQNAEIYVEKGSLILEDFCIIGDPYTQIKIIINDGHVALQHHCKLSCNRVWVRFGGLLTVGSYTNVNRGGEIRCDDNIAIGDYNQISYNVKIWDTNTHNMLIKEKRREVAERYFPYFGYEESRPDTSPVVIGNDCWIGESSAILKGSSIGNNVIVGFRTTIAGKSIDDSNIVVQDLKIKQIESKHE